jgi:hypothetical protein
MNNNHKYTTDGRKVLVLGDLNSNEKIVQEIFVSNGVEIPSGENFTVKSLHDAPVQSWKEKEAEKIEKRYDLIRDKFSKIEKDYNNQRSLMSQLIKQMRFSEDSINCAVTEQVLGFMSGEYNYVVIPGYIYDVKPFIDAMTHKDRFDSSVRLLSLYGKSNGEVCWKINQYSDGSGNSASEIIPAKTAEHAIEILTEKLLSGASERIHAGMIDTAEKYNIKLPEDKLIEYYEKELAETKKHHDRYSREFESSNNKISDISKKLSEMKSDRG